MQCVKVTKNELLNALSHGQVVGMAEYGGGFVWVGFRARNVGMNGDGWVRFGVFLWDGVGAGEYFIGDASIAWS
jgi:hypothetical protein